MKNSPGTGSHIQDLDPASKVILVRYKVCGGRDGEPDIIKNRFVASIQSVENSNENIEEVLLDRNIFSTLFNSLASTPAGQPFIAEQSQYRITKHLVNILKGGKNGKGSGKNIQLGLLSTDLGREGKEISGPQAAAEDMIRMIQEVRISKKEINE